MSRANRLPLRPLRGAILILGLVVIAVAAALSFFWQDYVQADKQLRVAQQRQAEHRARLARAAEERAEIAQLDARARPLFDAGLVGEESRLDWVDTINAIQTRYRLFKIDFEIGPQHTAPAELVGPAQAYWQWRASPMRLSFPALHEGDWLRVLDQLRAHSPWAHIEQCAVTRVHQPQPRGPAAHLSVDCRLQWISARRGTP